MNKFYILSLLTSCLTTSLFSMEPQPNKHLTHSQSLAAIPQLIEHTGLTSLSELDTKNIQEFHNKTCNDITKVTPTNNNAAATLHTILTSLKDLKDHNISEYQIGLFTYTQKNTFSKILDSFSNKPDQMSAIYYAIGIYNATLAKNEFSTPTIDQYSNYQKNKLIATDLETAASVGIFINPQCTSNSTVIPATVATQEFHNLINHIDKIQKLEPTTLTRIVKILYSSYAPKK